MKYLPLVIVLLAASQCGKEEKKKVETPPQGATQTKDPPKSDAGLPTPAKKPVVAPKEIKDPVLYCASGKCKPIDRSEVAPRGLSLIDLRDTFTPYIFTDKGPGEKDLKKNDYRPTFINLSNDITTEEGKKLKPGEHNYLELYGIPPSLTVLQKRFLKSASAPCALTKEYEIFAALKYNLVFDGSNPRKYHKRFVVAERAFKRWAKRKRIKDTELYLKAAQKRKKNPKPVRTYLRAAMRYKAFLALQRRLVCEDVITQKEIRKNAFDIRLKRAIRKYERKHMIFGWGFVNDKLRRHMSRPMLDNDFRALRRALHERVAHSLAIFEDGSYRTYSSKKGKRRRKGVDLIGRFRDLLMKEMGIETAPKALAYFKNRHSRDFEKLEVAVKLPKLPEYYSDTMDFFVKHSVGDLWYDVPYSPTGQRKGQPRSILPSVTLYVVHKGRNIPLARMGTTAGGWQNEYVEGQVFLKYKGSDLGPKEWKFVVGAPVWFPPPTTPPRELISYEQVRGVTRAVLRRKSFGPSYASAYGLAMALHTFSRKRRGKIEDLDRGIRTHGSVNYMSIRVGHSHGCHRLHNHIALRLFSNLLRRHPHKRLGQLKADWSHFITAGGRTLKIHLKTKGYYYEMEPPIPIRVTRGNILGRVKSPIKDLIRIPGKKYPPDSEIGMEIAPDGSLQPAGTGDATEVKSDGVPSALPDAPNAKPDENTKPGTMGAPGMGVPAMTPPAMTPAKPGAKPAKPAAPVKRPAKAPAPKAMAPAKKSAR